MITFKEYHIFKLIYDGLFRIEYNQQLITISIKPADLALIFEQEGKDLKHPDEEEDFSVRYHFKKVVLLISNSYILQLKDEYNQNISPAFCEVKI